MLHNLDPLNPVFAVAIMAVAILMSATMVRVFGRPAPSGSFSSLDGLRGLLGMAVFICHGSAWFFYSQDGNWAASDSIYGYFGQYAVALFFMLTGLLFSAKLLNSRSKSIDWMHLYISRVLRLFPLYLFVVLIVFIIVISITGFNLHQPVGKLLLALFRWLIFTIPNLAGPDINGVPKTALIIAAVTWSLAYEWLFYAMLPLGARLIGIRTSYQALIFSLLMSIGIAVAMHYPDPILLLIFMGGVVAAVLSRKKEIARLACGKIFSLVAIACIFGTAILFPGKFFIPSIILLTIGFTIIACGNTIFGLLLWPSLRLLGNISYSVYLLHGILLFITFRWIVPFSFSEKITSNEHWLIVAILTIPLILFSYATYRLIELPAMKAVPRTHVWLSLKLAQLSRYVALRKMPRLSK